MRFLVLLVSAALAITCFPCSEVQADTIDVPLGGDIQAAIDGASGGDIIQIAAGTFPITSTIDPGGKAVTIRGAADGDGEPTTILDGGGSVRVLVCQSGETAETVFENLVIQNGHAIDNGGGMYNNGSSPTLRNCTFTGNSADGYGGGIYSIDGGLSPVDCTFTSNTGERGAGVYARDMEEPTTFSDCRFIGNQSSNDGGGVSVVSTAEPFTAERCVFEGNTAGDDGGGLHHANLPVTLKDCTFTGNTAADDGGGSACDGSTPRESLVEDCVYADNIANGDGSALSILNANEVTLAGTTVCGGETGNQFQGDYTDGGDNCITAACDDSDDDGILDGCDPCPNWPGNCSEDGTMIYVTATDQSIQDAIDLVDDGGTVEIIAGTFAITSTIDPGGKAVTIRGAVDGDGAPTTVLDGGGTRRVVRCQNGETEGTVFENLVIQNGLASSTNSYGGGMYSTGSPTLINCTFTGNTAQDHGGGMYIAAGNSTLTNCTFIGNTTDLSGGGIYSNYPATPTLMNCTFTGNTAEFNGGGMFAKINPVLIDCMFTENSAVDGGGMYCDGSPSLTNCEYTGNTAAGSGGGLYAFDTNLTLSNCDVTGNTATASGGGVYHWAFGITSFVNLDGATICGNTVDGTATDENQVEGPYIETGVNCITADCTDTDGDAIPDGCDDCTDSDGDTICDEIDPCPNWPYDCSANGMTIYVNATDQSIQDAIDQVPATGTVEIIAGTFRITSTIDPGGKAVTILGAVDGDGAPTTILDGGQGIRVLECTSGETGATAFANLVVRNGSGSYAGGMYISGGSSPILTNCWFKMNSAGEGGAIYIDESSPTLNQCVFEENSAGNGGALFLYYESEPTFTDCRFAGNAATNWGGAVYVDQDENSPIFTRCDFSGNQSVDGLGGAMYSGDYNWVVLDECSFVDNTARRGGGLYTSHTYSVTMSTCTFAGNSTTEIDDLDEHGGGCYLNSTDEVLVTNCTFTNNTAGDRGGGIYSRFSSPTLTNCTITDNAATGSGGGVYNATTHSVTLDGTIICGNTVDGEATDENQVEGNYTETGVNCITAECTDADYDGLPDCDPPCVGDVNGDGEVDGADLAYVLGYWGTDEALPDLDDDGLVDSTDLGLVLSAWGTCP